MSGMSSIIKQHNYKVLSTTENLDYVIAEIKKTVLLMINVYKHISFARLMSKQIMTVISTKVLVMENLNLGILTTQIHFAMDITNNT